MRQDRAITQSSRAPLASTLIPAGDMPGIEVSRHLFQQFRAGKSLEWQAGLLQCLFHCLLGMFWPPVSMIEQSGARLVEHCVPNVERCAYRGPIIRSGALDVGAFEWCVAQNAGIAHTIERASAGGD